MGQPQARVRRDGQLQDVPTSELVPGDVVALEEGDVVPADLRILVSEGLEHAEAALTGESVPVSKSPEPVAPDTVLAERTSMAYRGTTVSRGQGEALVMHTGPRTELGRLAAMVEQAAPEATPLEKRLDRLARRLL